MEIEALGRTTFGEDFPVLVDDINRVAAADGTQSESAGEAVGLDDEFQFVVCVEDAGRVLPHDGKGLRRIRVGVQLEFLDGLQGVVVVSETDSFIVPARDNVGRNRLDGVQHLRPVFRAAQRSPAGYGQSGFHGEVVRSCVCYAFGFDGIV